MKKILAITLTIGFLIIIIFTLNKDIQLKGTYSSEIIDGKFIQLTIDNEDNSFIEYINQREVDRGSYTRVEENIYTFESDIQKFQITFKKNNSFNIFIDKINGENPINLKNSSTILQTFSTEFGDEHEYIQLIK